MTDPVHDLPIRPTEPTDTRCKHALMHIHSMGVKVRQPVDMQDSETVNALIYELWPDVDFSDAAQVEECKSRLPQDGGLYYLVYIDTPGDPEPVLLPAGEGTLGAAFVLGVGNDPDTAWRLVYRQGILPRRDIPTASEPNPEP